jgi:hypothetical protein
LVVQEEAGIPSRLGVLGCMNVYFVTKNTNQV